MSESPEWGGPACRLCGAPTRPLMDGTVLGRLPARWWACSDCGCAQTDPPHWLEEAYAPENLAVDTGQVQRTINLSLLLPVLLSPFGLGAEHRWLDHGGGDGLLCRLMRDRGFDVWRFDPFAPNRHALGFDKSDAPPGPWPVVTLFEVLEHLPDPARDLAELEALDADVIVTTTSPYAGQGPEWGYWHPEIGQHVFFWSTEGLRRLAERLDMRLVTQGNTHVFLRDHPKYLSPVERADLQVARILRDPAQAMTLGLRAFAEHLGDPYRWASRDEETRFQALGRVRDLTSLAGPLPGPPAEPLGDRPRVLIDGVFFQHYTTGIARYWENVLRQWGAGDFGREVLLLDRMGTAPRIPGIRSRIIPGHDFGDWEAQADLLDGLCAEEGATVFLSTYTTAPRHTPSLQVVYDMIPERLFETKGDAEWEDKARTIAQAERLVCISEATRADLLALHPSAAVAEVAIAYPGVDGARFAPPDSETSDRVARALFLPDRYLLMVGRQSSYKNGAALFDALRAEPALSGLPILVATAKGGLSDETRARAEGLTLLAHAFDDAELAVVYARASAFVSLSLLEGFGMPVVEAAACGCPVVCSDIPVYREVLGEAAIFVDPRSPEAIARGLHQALSPEGGAALRRAGIDRAARFTWKACAGVLEREIKTALAVVGEEKERA